MMYVIKIAAVLKEKDADDIIMDSEFAVIDDGNYFDKPTDSIKTVRFLNTIEVLKTGFENKTYAIKLVPVRSADPNLFCLLPKGDEGKRHGYTARSKDIMETLEKFGKKLGVEVRDPSEFSEFQRAIMKEVK